MLNIFPDLQHILYTGLYDNKLFINMQSIAIKNCYSFKKNSFLLAHAHFISLIITLYTINT